MVEPFVHEVSEGLRYGGRKMSSHGEIGMLGFLYPKKTVAYMNQLSEQRQDYLPRKYSHSKYAANTRLFSTVSVLRENVNSTEEGTITTPADLTISGESPVYALLQDPIDLTNVPSFLNDAGMEQDPALKNFWSHVHGKIPENTDEAAFEKVWKIYSKLDPTQTSPPEIMILLLNYLSFSDRDADRIRTGFLANKLDEQLSFWTVIVSHLSMGSIEAAVQVHDRAIRDGVTSYIGSDVILAHAIRGKRWDLALQVSATVISNIADPSNLQHIQDKLYDLWKLAMKLPDLAGYAVEYLDYAHERLDVNFHVVKAFMYHFVSAALSQCPEPNVSSDSILDAIENHHLNGAPIFEMAIKRLLDTIKTETRVHLSQRSLLQKIWQAYRRSCKPTDLKPGVLLRLLHTLSMVKVSCLATEVEQTSWIEELVKEFTFSSAAPALQNPGVRSRRSRHAGLRVRTLPYDVQVALMRMYSWRGSITEVLKIDERLTPSSDKLAAASRSEMEKKQDIQRACALIRVYGVHGDLLNGEKQFGILHQDLYQHRAVWMELLRLHLASNDISKAFDCVFNRMRAAGLPPDRESFHTLLLMCGHSGDFGTVNKLVTLAKEQNIDLGTSRIFAIILEHLRNYDFQAAEGLGLMLAETKMEPKSTLSLGYVWNTILHSAGKANNMVAVKRISNLMQEQMIAVDLGTYQAVVHMLIRRKETDKAAHIVKEVMPTNGFTPDERFYGMLVEGYGKEKLHAAAIEEFEWMVESGLKPNSITRANYLSSKAALERTDPMFDDKIIAEVEDAICHPENTTWIRGAPPLVFYKPSDQYLSALLRKYGEVDNEGMISRLWSLYLRSLNNTDWNGDRFSRAMSNELSLGVLQSLMQACLELGKHNLVLKLWIQSLSLVMKATRQWQTGIRNVDQIALTEAAASDDGTEAELSQEANASLRSGKAIEPTVPRPSNLDESIPSGFDISVFRTEAFVAEWKEIPDRLKGLLSAPLLVYISSLAAQRKFDDIISTVANLTSFGFCFSNRVWNEYVLLLCSSPAMKHVIAGFIGCEQHLIEGYRPWTQHLGKEGRLQFNIEERHNHSPHERRPENRTLFVLKSIAHVGNTKRKFVNAEEYGMGTYRFMLIEVLKKLAPKTMEAMNTWVTLRKGSERYAALPLWVQTRDRDRRKRETALEKARMRRLGAADTSLPGRKESGLEQLMAAQTMAMKR